MFKLFSDWEETSNSEDNPVMSTKPCMKISWCHTFTSSKNFSEESAKSWFTMAKTISSSKLPVLSSGPKEFILIKQKNSGTFILLFRNKLFSVWKVDGKTVGYKKSTGLYELRTVNNAGHLVPMDQGPAATQLLKDFVAGTSTQNDLNSQWSNENLTANWRFSILSALYSFK